MEWTKTTLHNFGDILHQASIFGAMAVSITLMIVALMYGEHFASYGGEAVYGATGKGKNVIPKQVAEARKLPMNISHEAILGVIYHALGAVATHPRGPGLVNACLPIHYVLRWLGEHFPNLTTRRCDSDFPEYYPLLARYSQIEAKYVDPT
ncbi:unnamed protein product [Prunus armeniaca]